MSALDAGFGSLLTLFLLTVSFGLVGILCKTLWTRRSEQNDEKRSHSVAYYVKIEDDNCASQYPRIPQTRQVDSEHTNRQRPPHRNSRKDKILTPNYLPSYDDIISDRFNGNIEALPLYTGVIWAQDSTSQQCDHFTRHDSTSQQCDHITRKLIIKKHEVNLYRNT